jgi:hypothetical protein
MQAARLPKQGWQRRMFEPFHLRRFVLRVKSGHHPPSSLPLLLLLSPLSALPPWRHGVNVPAMRERRVARSVTHEAFPVLQTSSRRRCAATSATRAFSRLSPPRSPRCGFSNHCKGTAMKMSVVAKHPALALALGPNTAQVARRITAYEPDSTWRAAE